MENRGTSENEKSSNLLTTKECAEYLNLHLVTVYRLLKRKEIPAVRLGGQWRFKKDALNAWLNRRMK